MNIKNPVSDTRYSFRMSVGPESVTSFGNLTTTKAKSKREMLRINGGGRNDSDLLYCCPFLLDHRGKMKEVNHLD